MGIRQWARSLTTPLLAAAAIAQVALLVPTPAQAQTHNSREATEAVRRHRAETGTDQRTTAPAEAPARRGKAARNAAPQPAAGANWEQDLAWCLDMKNPKRGTREACVWQHCRDRWGQGQCPAGREFLTTQGANSRTELGRCLQEAGKNPFRRDGCGWRVCKGKSTTSAECAAFYEGRQ